MFVSHRLRSCYEDLGRMAAHELSITKSGDLVAPDVTTLRLVKQKIDHFEMHLHRLENDLAAIKRNMSFNRL